MVRPAGDVVAISRVGTGAAEERQRQIDLSPEDLETISAVAPIGPPNRTEPVGSWGE